MRYCENCRDYLYPGESEGKYCGGCKVVSCKLLEGGQRADWGRHKRECEHLKQEAIDNRVPEEHVYGQRRQQEQQQQAASSSSAGGSSEAAAASASAGSSGGGSREGAAAASSTGGGVQEAAPRLVRAMCGLCGGRQKPFRFTDCCGRVVCDDHANYVMMSYSRDSCARNHSRYTMCAAHHNEGHAGRWQDCQECRANYSEYDYWTYACNPPGLPPCNFPDTVPDIPRPPLPTCARCSRSIETATEGYSYGPDGLTCLSCRY